MASFPGCHNCRCTGATPTRHHRVAKHGIIWPACRSESPLVLSSGFARDLAARGIPEGATAVDDSRDAPGEYNEHLMIRCFCYMCTVIVEACGSLSMISAALSGPSALCVSNESAPVNVVTVRWHNQVKYAGNDKNTSEQPGRRERPQRSRMSHRSGRGGASVSYGPPVCFCR